MIGCIILVGIIALGWKLCRQEYVFDRRTVPIVEVDLLELNAPAFDLRTDQSLVSVIDPIVVEAQVGDLMSDAANPRFAY